MHLGLLRIFTRASSISIILGVFVCEGLSQAKPAPSAVPFGSASGATEAGLYSVPTGQILTPAGQQIPLPGMRPQALTLSPNGRLLAVAGNTEVFLLIDPRTGTTLQTVPLSFITTEVRTNQSTNGVAETVEKISNLKSKSTSIVSVTNRAQLSLTGLIFSPDSSCIYLSNAKGNIWVFALKQEKVIGRPRVFSLPDADAPKQRKEIPSGLAVSSDGARLYVTGNLGNKLCELDSYWGNLLRSWDTGFAPYDVVLAGNKAYVSNLGGRLPGEKDRTALAGLGTRVRVDVSRDIANEGSLTVVDLVEGLVTSELKLELHPSAMVVSPNQKYLVIANTGSDTLSVVNTTTDCVVEKISARQTPADLFGAQPNALAFDRSGRRLYVGNGTQNAVGVIEFEPASRTSKMLGLIPVGWFPSAIQFDPRSRNLFVANLKGIGAAKLFKPDEKFKLNSKDFFGTISRIPDHSDRRLSGMTQLALRNMRYPRLAEALLPPRPDKPPRPVPERSGEPSVFKHIIYIIKENRSYDQVLGDMPEGNGDRSLCTFGEEYTPNQHKIARDFVLLDNTYCSGICSADGHQWTDSALANEYVERQLTSGSPRSYSGSKSADAADALAWASSGFIWDNVLEHGKTFRNYGEWMLSHSGWSDSKKKEKIMWSDFWGAFNTNADLVRLRSRAMIRTLRNHSDTNSVGWDLKVPDVMRAAQFIRELHEFETKGGFPNLLILFLPNDHTGGEKSDYPVPGSQVADNDLAVGRVLEALTHSRFWTDTCLFAIEDDPQAGWDHVSGYRTTCYVASPYTRRRRTVSTQYNQVSLVRTIELILGLPPMNQLDASATPMSDCFTNVPDLTPFSSVPNRFPLDKITPDPKKIADRRVRQDVIASNRLPLDQPDRCPEDLLNRILWRAMKGVNTPYPEWAVKLVEDAD
jgi:YVTN family beta-propeller protein